MTVCLEGKKFKIQKGYDTVTKNFRLPEKMAEKLDKLAYRYNLSLNQLVVQCLSYALDNLDESGLENEESK